MKIFSGRNYQKMTAQIVEDLSVLYDKELTINNLTIDKFSDGEILPIFRESIRDEKLFFVNSLSNSDEIIETLLVIDAAKRAGCKKITLIAPYIGYSRQDKTDFHRSSIGSKMIANLLTGFGSSSISIDNLVTIDLHSETIPASYDIPVIHLYGTPIFLKYLRGVDIDNLCIVAPDTGAIRRAGRFCKQIPEASFAYIEKTRIKPNEIHSMILKGDVNGKDVVIVDDIADTCGTLSKASDLLFSNGAKTVNGIITHGVLSGHAIETIEKSSISQLIVSDTISSVYEKESSKIRVISSADLLSKSIYAITKKKSVSVING